MTSPVSTTAPCGMGTNLQFQTWIQEIITQLVTNCGLSNFPADTGQINTASVTLPPPLAANLPMGYSIFCFNDTLSEGAIAATVPGVTTNTGSAPYTTTAGTASTFTNVALSYATGGAFGSTAPAGSGTGSGAIATVVFGAATGLVTSVTITSVGTGYMPGDSLTFTNAALAAATHSSGTNTLTGTGAGAVWVVANTTGKPVFIKLEYGCGTSATIPQMWITTAPNWVQNSTIGGTGAVVLGIGICNAGYGYNNSGNVTAMGAVTGSNTGYNGGASSTAKTVSIAGGTGTGLQLSISVAAGGAVTIASIVAAGTGYLTTDIFTLTSAEMVTAGFAAGGGAATLPVSTVGGTHAAVTTALTNAPATSAGPTSSGTGTGATSQVTVGNPGGSATVNTMNLGGTGYTAGDVLLVSNATGLATFGNASVAGQGASAVISTMYNVVANVNYAGLMTQRVAVLCNAGLTTNLISAISRYIWNPTYGFCAMAFKQNTALSFLGGFAVFRSTSTAGAATGDNVNVIANSYTYAGLVSQGQMQSFSTLTNLTYPNISGVALLLAQTEYWAGASSQSFLDLASTLYNGNCYIIPVYYATPIPCVATCMCIAIFNEAPIHSTFTSAIVGATTLTFLSCGGMFGSNSATPASNSPGGAAASQGGSVCILWQ